MPRKLYTLRDKNNLSIQSFVKGKFGGHKGSRLYGRLDCPTALRYIAKGMYVKSRVFFLDEATAIAAGYRPCTHCMPVQYKKWKSQRE